MSRRPNQFGNHYSRNTIKVLKRFVLEAGSTLIKKNSGQDIEKVYYSLLMTFDSCFTCFASRIAYVTL